MDDRRNDESPDEQRSREERAKEIRGSLRGERPPSTRPKSLRELIDERMRGEQSRSPTKHGK